MGRVDAQEHIRALQHHATRPHTPNGCCKHTYALTAIKISCFFRCKSTYALTAPRHRSASLRMDAVSTHMRLQPSNLAAFFSVRAHKHIRAYSLASLVRTCRMGAVSTHMCLQPTNLAAFFAVRAHTCLQSQITRPHTPNRRCKRTYALTANKFSCFLHYKSTYGFTASHHSSAHAEWTLKAHICAYSQQS